MNQAPHLYQSSEYQEAPRPARPFRNWWPVAAFLGTVLAVQTYVSYTAVTDARAAAVECRRAAEDLRVERILMERDRARAEAAQKDVLAKAMSVVLKAEGKKRGDE